MKKRIKLMPKAAKVLFKNSLLGLNLISCILLLSLFASTLWAQPTNPSQQQSNSTSLEDLEAFVARYENVQALLNDSEGLEQYRRLLKSYMRYKEEFDAVFDKTIKQMRVLVDKVPNFAEQIWMNQTGNKVIRLEASSVKRSGIETKIRVLEERMAQQREHYSKAAGEFLALSEEDRLKCRN